MYCEHIKSINNKVTLVENLLILSLLKLFIIIPPLFSYIFYISYYIITHLRVYVNIIYAFILFYLFPNMEEFH